VILADNFREARAKNDRNSSMDDEDLQRRTSEESYCAQRTRTIDRDDKKCLYHAPEDDKNRADAAEGGSSSSLEV
jgi:hypothetical protein